MRIAGAIAAALLGCLFPALYRSAAVAQEGGCRLDDPKITIEFVIDECARIIDQYRRAPAAPMQMFSEFLTVRAAAYEKAGEKQRALSDFREALELNPANTTARGGIDRLDERKTRPQEWSPPTTAVLPVGVRVALVVGNSAYQHAPKLSNPKNDANDVAAALRKFGFRVVEGFDLDKAAFDRKVREFAGALKGADAGLLFYAGHGLQVAGENYLVPIDAKAEDAASLEFEMLRASVIHRIMEQQTNTNILFLDACRDNPLARNLARSMGTRSAEVGSGLARIESGVGTLISFSTQPGNVALDGTGRNSPFAGALVKQLDSSTDDLGAMLIAVRNEVMQTTQRKQVPWENSALTGRFYFKTAAQIATAPKVEPARLSEAAEAWDRVKDASSVAMLESYATRYKDTIYAEWARGRIDELKKSQVAVAKSEPEQKAKQPDPVEQKTAMIETTAPKPLSPARPAKPLTPDEERGLKPKDTFKECDECPEMVVVPAGEFVMGSPATEEDHQTNEAPQRKVRIGKPFAVGKFELTFAEWDACVGESGCKHKPDVSGWGRGKQPVLVSWDDITNEYLPWLSRKTGKTYRPLAEAEWEYAARAGTTTRYAFGDKITKAEAQFSEGRMGSAGKPVKVGSFKPNAFGLHDMHGNLWEWVQDCWKNNLAGAPLDGTAFISRDCTYRVVRGGSWVDHPGTVRSTNRGHNSPDTLNTVFGFRVARTLD